MAQRQERQHVTLAPAQPIRRGPLVLRLSFLPIPLQHDERGRVRSEEQSTLGHRADRSREVLYRTGLLDESARARLERVQQLPLLWDRREHEDLGSDGEGDDPARGLQPSFARHGQIHEDDVRPSRLRAPDGFVAGSGLADHDEIALLLEQRAQPGPEDHVIVHQQDADVIPHLVGRTEGERRRTQCWHSVSHAPLRCKICAPHERQARPDP